VLELARLHPTETQAIEELEVLELLHLRQLASSNLFLLVWLHFRFKFKMLLRV
jgi:hypothetical protein